MSEGLNKIVRGCQQGHSGAQRELYDYFKSRMFGICLRYTGNYDDAQDVLQEGFLKVFGKIHQFEFKGSFEGWIRKIMVNTALEKYRSHYRMAHIEDNIPDEPYEQQSGIPIDIGQHELLRYIQELPPKYRSVFNLYAIEGFSHKEISEMLKISEGTSKSNLSRARAILRKKVNRYNVKSVHFL
ncbi:MAG: RNA polymerase sigma factor [Bacteroidales bacterium]|nr:RNA polymerase sigma factor [Bacteroidales bacterium]